MDKTKTKNQEKPEKDNIQKTICIIQLTRKGDIIQTVQASKDLKKQRKDIRLMFVCYRSMASGLEFLIDEVFEKTVYLDPGEIYKNASSLKDLKDNTKGFLSNFSAENIDVLINLSFSKVSQYLAGLIRSNHKLGTHTNELGEEITIDRWSQHICTSVKGGSLNPFHLVDIYKIIIGGTDYLSEVSPSKINKSNKIVVHPFSSHEKKNWEPKKWTEIIYKTLKDLPAANMIIVGAPDEKIQADIICNNPILKRYSKRIQNRVGKYSLEELFHLLGESKLFVGHDSMVGHLASMAQLQSLTLSLGTVRPHETTPFGINNYVLQPRTKCFPCFPDDSCDFFKCHSDISYQSASQVIKILWEKGEVDSDTLKSEISHFHLSNCLLWKTVQKSSGLMDLEDVGKDDLTAREAMRLFYRIAFLFNFTGSEENNSYPNISTETKHVLKNYMLSISQLFELLEFGKKYSKFILQELAKEAPSVDAIKEFGAKIDEIDNLSNALQKMNPLLSPIIDMGKVLRGNNIGQNLVILTENSYLIYNELTQICSIVYELIEKTLHKDEPNKQSPETTK